MRATFYLRWLSFTRLLSAAISRFCSSRSFCFRFFSLCLYQMPKLPATSTTGKTSQYMTLVTGDMSMLTMVPHWLLDVLSVVFGRQLLQHGIDLGGLKCMRFQCEEWA